MKCKEKAIDGCIYCHWCMQVCVAPGTMSWHLARIKFKLRYSFQRQQSTQSDTDAKKPLLGKYNLYFRA